MKPADLSVSHSKHPADVICNAFWYLERERSGHGGWAGTPAVHAAGTRTAPSDQALCLLL